MYAVIVSGSKQHVVKQGDVIRLEKLAYEPGETVKFDQILMVGGADAVKVGSPLVQGATVEAEVKRHGREDKIKIIKFRRRKHHEKQMGHRQWYTEVEIKKIED